MTDITAQPEPAPPPAPVPSGWEGILDRDERILWQGRPDVAVIWTDLISAQSVFGLFFGGFALFWMATAYSIGGHMDGGPGPFQFFPLFGLPFFAVGLYMVIGRIFWDAFQRRGTFYTLTNKAGYIATESLGRRKLARHALEADKLSLEDGAPGTVWFAEKVVTQRTGNAGNRNFNSSRRTYTTRSAVGFRRIAEARQVYRLIRDALEGRSAAG